MSRTEEYIRADAAKAEGRAQAEQDRAARKRGCTPCPYPRWQTAKIHAWIDGYTMVRAYRDAFRSAGKQHFGPMRKRRPGG